MNIEITFAVGLVAVLLGGLLSEYVLSKKEFHYHTLAVLIAGLPYIVGDFPKWLYEPTVRLILIVLYASLAGRAIAMCSPKASRVSRYIILVFFVWRLALVFVR